jgi:hypothetical protein
MPLPPAVTGESQGTCGGSCASLAPDHARQPAKKARLVNTARLRSFARFPTSPNRFAGDFLRNFDPEGKFIIPILSIRKTLSCNRSYTIRFGAAESELNPRNSRIAEARETVFEAGTSLTSARKMAACSSTRESDSNTPKSQYGTAQTFFHSMRRRYGDATVESFNNPKLSFFTATNLL